MFRPRRLALWVAVCAFSALIAIVGAGAAFLVAQMYPRRLPALPAGSAEAGAREVEIQARDGATLHASWLAADRPEADCVLTLHGLSDRRNMAFARMMHQAGFGALAPDLRAHGESGGQLVTFGLVERHDAVAWAHWMRAQGCRKIYGHGVSLGAAILLQAAAVEPVFPAAIAESAFADLEETASYRLGRFTQLPSAAAAPLGAISMAAARIYVRQSQGVDLSDVSPLRAIAATRTAFLLIHGAADQETPASQSEQLAAANPAAELWLVPHAGHNDVWRVAGDEYRRRVLEWIASH